MGQNTIAGCRANDFGQEFEGICSYTWKKKIDQTRTENAKLFLEVNMGATAIGTGINAPKGYSEKCIEHLREITDLDIVLAENLVEATQDTGAFVMYSSAIKRLAIKLSKIS
jgi:aspartate ammonia-lyase